MTSRVPVPVLFPDLQVPIIGLLILFFVPILLGVVSVTLSNRRIAREAKKDHSGFGPRRVVPKRGYGSIILGSGLGGLFLAVSASIFFYTIPSAIAGADALQDVKKYYSTNISAPEGKFPISVTEDYLTVPAEFTVEVYEVAGGEGQTCVIKTTAGEYVLYCGTPLEEFYSSTQ